MRWFRRGPNRSTAPKVPPLAASTAVPPPAAPPWSLTDLPRPWTGESILTFIRAGLDPDGGLRDDHAILPDEPPDTGQIRWAPGALDGVMTSHTRNADDSPADAVVAAILALADRADATTLAATVETLRTTDVLPVIDTVLHGLADTAGQARYLKVRAIGRLLATEAPERQLVKYGIGLVGVFGDVEEDRPSLEILGAHQEFTLFVAVALTNLQAGEHALWELAKRVDGWGRIQLVHRMTGTHDPEIRAWMLRDGFRNSVMDEYLAYTCAMTGDLVAGLAPDDIDDALFDGATDMLAAMARGGPAEDLGDYPFREEAVSRWLDHVEARGPSIGAVSAMDDMQEAPLSPGLLARLNAIRLSPAADAAVRAALASDEAQTFARGAAAARPRGIDATDRLLARTAAGDRYATFALFAQVDETHIDEALTIMHARLDLAALGSGPATELGLGEAFRDQFDLETVTNALARFPGRGTDFVLTSLRSPVIRGRHAAIRTIRAWEEAGRTPEIRAALEVARGLEPNDAVREAIDAALEDQPRV